MARTMLIGLRRDPHPPIPMVMPSRNSATTSSSVIRLSTTLLLVLAENYLEVSASRFSTNASRSSSETPARLSSKVKPCSNR